MDKDNIAISNEVLDWLQGVYTVLNKHRSIIDEKVLLIVILSSMFVMLFGTMKKDNKTNDSDQNEDISESISLPIERIDSSDNNK